MFSRAGKSTVNQYSAFAESAHARSLEVARRFPVEEMDDLEEEIQAILDKEPDSDLKSKKKSTMFLD